MSATTTLRQQDPVMKNLIAKYGELTLTKSKDYFADLASSIVGQQLSAKAASTIWGRVTTLLGGEITATKALSIEDEAYRQAGCSTSKTRYIKALAQAVSENTLRFEELADLDNEAVIERLTTVKGIGRWTAEMFLIFSLARPDVFSFGDGGLKSAMDKLYGGMLSRKRIEEITDKWKPYRSYASLYLWASLDNKEKK